MTPVWDDPQLFAQTERYNVTVALKPEMVGSADDVTLVRTLTKYDETSAKTILHEEV